MIMRYRALILIMIVLTAGEIAGQKRARPVTITGRVTDTLFSPISGALIVADGISTGITTKYNGTYKIRMRSDIRTLGVYTEDLGSAMTLFDGGSVVDFVLDGRIGMPGFKPMGLPGDTEVDIGYGTKKKKDLTTDVGYVDAQDNANASYTNIYDMIRGKVPGVQVTGNKIIIRGISSINLSSDPLLVVDGVVVNTIDHINPRQVKSISVLKGSDASIYGSRGANGVILITLLGAER